MSLEKIDQIKVREFNFKENPEKKVIGFVAQELYKVIPDAVIRGGEDPQKEPWKVDYLQIVPIVVQAIQELHERLKKIEEQLK